jgi:uncharacterized iron-regulated protein
MSYQFEEIVIGLNVARLPDAKTRRPRSGSCGESAAFAANEELRQSSFSSRSSPTSLLRVKQLVSVQTRKNFLPLVLRPACLLLSACAVLLACLPGLFAPSTVRAQEVVENQPLATSTLHIHRVEYMRELWVGLAHENVPAKDLLQAMRNVCDDTTAVAIIEAHVSEDLKASESDNRWLRRFALRDGLEKLTGELKVDRRFTRTVIVGAFESCFEAARLAIDHAENVDGLFLIDPPVRDLPRMHVDEMVGVDVILHSRSQDEFNLDRSYLQIVLGPWANRARFVEGSNRFGNLEQRMAELYSHVRGYTLIDADGIEDGAALARKLADYDVVIIGELHGNPGAHRLQLEFLREYASHDRKLALSTEQFERDVQAHVDAFLADDLDETEFMEKSRAWPNYADYRPLLDVSREHGVHVIAGNIPRRLANRIFRQGVESFEEFTEEERAWSAREMRAEPGKYRDKFMRTMRGMGGGHGHGDDSEADARLESMYASQAIKDDTMAESIHDWLKANPGARVLHINGTFHSEGGLGVPEKLAHLNPNLRVAIVSCVEASRDMPEATENEWMVRVPASRPMRR